MILHLAGLILLGLLSISSPPSTGYELVFAPDLLSDDQDLDFSEPLAVELLAERNSTPPVAEPLRLEISPAPAISLSWDEFVAAEGFNTPSGLLAQLGGLSNGKGGQGYSSVFGLSGEGTKFVYVFDRSESMNSVYRLYRRETIVSQFTLLGLAKAELLRSLRELAEYQEFQIVFYNHSPLLFRADEDYDNQKLYAASPEHKQLVSKFVETVPGEGNTNHWSALQAAISLRPDVIFLITDGESKDDPPLHQIRAVSRYCRKKHIRINVLHFSEKVRPRCTLIELAEGTRGMHRFIDLRTFARTTK